MKTHTNDFKSKIKDFGRELDSIITFEYNGEEMELGNSQLNSISPHYEGSILKSVMKQLDIDSNVYIPKGTILHYQFGVKVRDDNVQDYRDNYDYIDYGNYEVYSVEKQEDNGGYKIICYDKMLKSMVDYEHMNINYPITIRNYISAICNHLGLTFKNASETFVNYDKEINGELYMYYNADTQEYETLGYTFRDVLDELAQVTASTICIDKNDNLEIRYITSTGDTINEEYLKNINVNFGEQTDAINTIVLSRSGGSDKIYKSYPENLPEADRVAIEISDNQIMNQNNREDYIPEILNQLLGLQYYLNDFSSTGICYYDLCDRYNIQIGEQTYSCVMFNDEINITQGLEENIHTDLPEENETDYNTAGQTDRTINRAYIIVNKQNLEIESVVERVLDDANPDSVVSQMTIINQQYDDILLELQNVADLTKTAEGTTGSVILTDILESNPVEIKIHPIAESISYLYPHIGLYPSDTLYPKNRALRFTNTTTNQYFDWELPTDLWRYSDEVYDDLTLSYSDGITSNILVNRRCQPNADGTISELDNPTTETYPYPFDILQLTDGDYTITLLGYPSAYLKVTLMVKNLYTSQFYTKAQTDNKIEVSAEGIEESVNATLTNGYYNKQSVDGKLALKLGKNEYGQLISMLNASADEITLTGGSKINLTTAGKLLITAGNFKLDASGNIIANNGTFTNGNFNGVIKNTGRRAQNVAGEVYIESGAVTSKSIYDGSNITYRSVLDGNGLDIYDDSIGYNYPLGRYKGGSINLRYSDDTSQYVDLQPQDLTLYDNKQYTICGRVTTYTGDDYDLGFRTQVRNSNAKVSLLYTTYNNLARLICMNSSGNGYGLDSSNGVISVSDKRDKDHIEDIDEKTSINIINKLNPVSFTYKKEDRYHRGLIAQDVKKALDDNNIENQIYSYNVDNKHFQLSYEEFIADIINVEKYLLKQVKEQQEEIELLKEEIKTLKESDK